MVMKLMIVESPSKAPKIEKMLGKNEWRVLATKGHICVINDGLKGLSGLREGEEAAARGPEIKYKTKNYEFLKKAKAEMADSKGSNVYIATDDDREGEAIGYHVCRLLRIDPLSTKRLRFNAIEKSAIEEAIRSPGILNMNLVHAQMSRQAIDLALGYTASPVLWKAIGGSQGLSAGRCQTPALTLVCDAHKAHSESQTANTNAISWSTQSLIPKCSTPFKSPSSQSITDQKQVEPRLNAFQLTPCELSKPTTTKHTLNPPTPLSTARLQQQCGMGTKRCMNAAQKLYEAGAITYHRTDSIGYCDKFCLDLAKFIETKHGDGMVGKMPKTVGGAHEAIRVTDLARDVAGSSADEKRLYQFIRKRTIASAMCKCEYSKLSRTLKSHNGDTELASLNKIIQPGWTLWEKASIVEATEAAWKQLSEYSLGEVECKQTEATPSVLGSRVAPLTESQLVKKLEQVGVGRPSTYAGIVNKLFERKYAVVQDVESKKVKTSKAIQVLKQEVKWDEIEVEFGGVKGRLTPTELGLRVQKMCVEVFNDLVAVETTATMENNLDKVADGEVEWNRLAVEYWDKVDKQATSGKEKLKSGEVKVEKASGTGKSLAEFEGHAVELCHERYGAYLKWNGQNIKIKGKRMPTSTQAIELVQTHLAEKAQVRELGDGISIRPGKKGGKYAMVKNGKKVEFVQLKGCSIDVDNGDAKELRDWIKSQL
jgi:DNA topoisomerase-1